MVVVPDQHVHPADNLLYSGRILADQDPRRNLSGDYTGNRVLGLAVIKGRRITGIRDSDKPAVREYLQYAWIHILSTINLLLYFGRCRVREAAVHNMNQGAIARPEQIASIEDDHPVGPE